jgi:hypothetical protein
MLDGNIMQFAGLYLEKHEYLTSLDLQRFIKDRPEVGKAIDIDRIEETLDNM